MFAQLVALLTEIRDRLPAPRSGAQVPESCAVLFDYATGSGEVPNQAQVDCARHFLDGSMFRDGQFPPTYPPAAFELAREIVRMGEGHGL